MFSKSSRLCPTAALLGAGRRLRAVDDEVVHDAEGARDVRFDAGDVLIAHVIHHTEQRDPSVVYDDVDGVIACRLRAGKAARTERLEPGTEGVAMSPKHSAPGRVA